MSHRIAFRNKKGVTLVEVMISLVVLLIVSMGMIQASLLAVDQNMRNEVRDAAVQVASETMADCRTHFTSLSATAGVCVPLALAVTGGYPATVTRTLRNQAFQFTRCAVVTDLDFPVVNKQVQVAVYWNYRGENPSLVWNQPNSSHTIRSIVRNR